MYSHSNNILPLSGLVDYTPNIGYYQVENIGEIDLISNSQRLLKSRSEREIVASSRKSLMLENIKVLKLKQFEPQHLYVEVETSSQNKPQSKYNSKNVHQLKYQQKYNKNYTSKKLDEKRITHEYSNFQKLKSSISKPNEGFSMKGATNQEEKGAISLIRQNSSK